MSERRECVRPANFLFLLSDQHSRDALGCYGSPVVRTPHLDALAAQGTKFTAAYSSCPLCVPVRASMATGRYVHEIGYWDNAFPYDGVVPSWHHRLHEQGYRVDSIGKLHFSGPGNDHGFSQELNPLHVVDGVGDILGCLRDNGPVRLKRSGITDAGPGDSTYLDYDRCNADAGVAWLDRHKEDDKPWALFLSFVCPHPPYISPPEHFEHYAELDLPMPPQWREENWPDHPAINHFRRFFDFHPQFEETEIRCMLAAYYGACSHLDNQIGRVLDHLEALGLTDRTRIIYSSDHGEHRGARGVYGKFTLYEESVGVPMIMAGPDVPEATVRKTPVSLIDIYPTALECVGAESDEKDLPGQSLLQLTAEPDRDRTVFSEYHALGQQHGSYMLRDRRYKYNHYVGLPPQLFDLEIDPWELNDLADSPEHAEVLQEREWQLRELLNPESVDERARADQRERVARFGGEQAVLERGAFDNSPVPGEDPVFRKH
ncbi:MAG: sulfatase-like hydrolase/transferase [Candidatus Latescibacterota bacterium]|nr:sulfatase-like hydrolase/transferase [Candidatus Latescibacterota bacterium]